MWIALVVSLLWATVAVAAVCWWLAPEAPMHADHVGARVVVTTRDVSLIGTLDAATDDTLRLTDVELMERDQRRQMDGVVLVELDLVDWVQAT